MKALRLMLLLGVVIVGLISRRHAKPVREAPPHDRVAQTAVNQEILQNAERLAETLRQCKQTAHKNQETK